MESVSVREALQSYRELLQEMLVISRRQLEVARDTALEDEKLEEFNRLIAERQALMERIDVLPVKFAKIREKPELKDEVEGILGIVKAIQESDEVTGTLLRKKAAAVWARLLEVQTGRKAMKAYNKEDETIAPWFFDTRK